MRHLQPPAILVGAMLALASCAGSPSTGVTTKKSTTPKVTDEPAGQASSLATPASASSGLPAGPLLRGHVLAAPAQLIGPNGGGVLSNNSAGVISPNGSGVVSNNGGSLINDGGPMLWRLLAVETKGVANARVRLLGANGAPLGGEVTADAEGGFALPLAADAGLVTVEASFEVSGLPYTYRAATVAGEEATLDLDEASTLVAEKVAKDKAFRSAAGGLRKFTAAVRAALEGSKLPFMARESRDRLAALDQLLLDTPALQTTATEVAASLATPDAPWQVATVIDKQKLAAAGFAELANALSRTQSVLASPNGGIRVILPLGEGPRIAELSPEGRPRVIGKVPAEAALPYRLVAAPDDSLFLVGRVRDEGVLGLWSVGADGQLTRRPGYLASIGSRQDIDIGQIALDAAGNAYMADTAAHVVRKLAQGAAAPVVAAGKEGTAGWVDGPAADARFTKPEGIALGSDGAVYVADTGNNALRRIAADGRVSTVAGHPGETDYRNGRGPASRLGAPETLAFAENGDLFVTDRATRRVRRLSKDGSVFLVAGTGEAGNADGPGHQASFASPTQLSYDKQRGWFFLRDVVNKGSGDPELAIRRIQPPAP